jgi:glycosyltransferase involved in cell wall biosynthesis
MLSFSPTFGKEIDVGKRKMSELRVVFCGIARDNGKNLKKCLQNISRMGALCKSYECVFFENDSTDDTLQILQSFPVTRVISKRGIASKKRPSISFLAQCRNEYLQYIKDHLRHYDCVIVVDLDMYAEWDMRGIFSTFAEYDRWDFVGSNGIATREGIMQDVFAFRTEQYPTPSYDHDNWLAFANKHVRKCWYREDGLMKVLSCFGGLGIYKTDAICSSSYVSIREDCEHVGLHDEMRRRGYNRLFMNPKQIIPYEDFSMGQKDVRKRKALRIKTMYLNN